MNVCTLEWGAGQWDTEQTDVFAEADLVLVFGGRHQLQEGASAAVSAAPNAIVAGCSTAGEISGESVSEEALVGAAVSFDSTRVRAASARIQGEEKCREAGRELAQGLAGPDLAHVFVLAAGRHVNGSDLVRGIADVLPAGVAVTGGLAGDGDRFGETAVVVDGVATGDAVTGIGFYGQSLRVGYGSLGGWDAFGTERVITGSRGNTLYTLDGKPALELYKRYLGDRADDLPSAGLLFPLAVRERDSEDWVVRTLLDVDEDDQSITFAGEMRQGDIARLMAANFDRLIDGAGGAASHAHTLLEQQTPGLAILISCVGRKLVLGQRVEEEVEVSREVLGEPPTIGFYSYGEICPSAPDASCDLHNQTMTVTTFREA